MVQCCPSCCYREDGTRKRKLKTWAIVLLSLLALGLGLGLGLAVKLYYFTPTRVIASVNLLGHNSDTFTAAEQVKFRTGISTLLSVELGKVAVSSVSDLTSARRRRVFLRKLLSSTSSTASARIKVGFTVEVKNRASVDDMEDLITLQTATQITSALQAAGMTGISSSAATVESQISDSVKNVTTLDDLIGGGSISSLDAQTRAGLEAALETPSISIIPKSSESSTSASAARTRAYADRKRAARARNLAAVVDVDVNSLDADSDFNLFETDVYIEDQTQSIFEFPNMVMCYLRQIPWFREANLGPFVANLDVKPCEERGGSEGESSNAAPKQYTWIVDSTMPNATNGLDEVKVNVWVSIPARSEWDPARDYHMQYTIHEKDIIKKSNDTIQANGLVGKDVFVIRKRFIRIQSVPLNTSTWAGYFDEDMKAVVSIANNIDGDVTSMAHAEEMTYGTSYSNTASSFTKLNTTSGFSQSAYEVPSYHWGSESNKSVVARGYSTTNDGKIKTKHAWSGDETCQSATVRHYFADAYYLFNSVGKRITSQSWYALHTTGSDGETYRAWMSYPGWFGIDYYDVDTWEQMDNTRKAIADAAFAVGSTVKIDDWDGDTSNDASKILKYTAGTLMKTELQSKQLSEYAGAVMYIYSYYYNSSSWVSEEIVISYDSSLSQTMVLSNSSMTTGHSAYQLVYANIRNTWGQIYVYSNVFGWNFAYLTSATTIKLEIRQPVRPGDLTTNLTLVCTRNCVTPGFNYNTSTPFTYNDDLITDGSTYDFEFDDRTEYLEYSFGTDGTLWRGGVEVKYNGDTDSWNYQQMYGLFESTSDNFNTLNCGTNATGSVCDSSDNLAVRYEWFSSNWDKFAYLVDNTNSSDLTFCEGPKNLKSVLPTDTSALRASPSGTSYAGKEVDFTWASGWVWGLPEACFNWNTGEVKNKTLSSGGSGLYNAQCDWSNNFYSRSDVVLPDGETVWDALTNETFIVKPQYLGQAAKFLPNATCDGMTYDETITLPTIAVEFDTLGALDLGAKPTNVRLANRTDTTRF